MIQISLSMLKLTVYRYGVEHAVNEHVIFGLIVPFID